MTDMKTITDVNETMMKETIDDRIDMNSTEGMEMEQTETTNNMKGTETMKENEGKEVITGTTQQVEVTTIALGKIQILDALRCRPSEDERTIVEYSEIFKEYQIAKEKGEKPAYPFPPVKVWRNSDWYALLGGFHRVAAARRAGLDAVLAEVVCGTEDEAFDVALTDNWHGLKLSAKDKKYIVEKALLRFPDRSLRMIAQEVRCSVAFVSKIAKELHAIGDLKPVETKIGLDGKPYTVKSSSTGKVLSAVVVEKVPKKVPLDRQLDKLIAPIEAMIASLTMNELPVLKNKLNQLHWAGQSRYNTLKQQMEQGGK